MRYCLMTCMCKHETIFESFNKSIEGVCLVAAASAMIAAATAVILAADIPA